MLWSPYFQCSHEILNSGKYILFLEFKICPKYDNVYLPGCCFVKFAPWLEKLMCKMLIYFRFRVHLAQTLWNFWFNNMLILINYFCKIISGKLDLMYSVTQNKFLLTYTNKLKWFYVFLWQKRIFCHSETEAL